MGNLHTAWGPSHAAAATWWRSSDRSRFFRSPKRIIFHIYTPVNTPAILMMFNDISYLIFQTVTWLTSFLINPNFQFPYPNSGGFQFFRGSEVDCLNGKGTVSTSTDFGGSVIPEAKDTGRSYKAINIMDARHMAGCCRSLLEDME